MSGSDGSIRTRRWVANILGLVVLASVAFQITMVVLTPEAETGARYGPRGMGVVFGPVLLTIGYLLAVRRPKNPIGWFLICSAVSVSVSGAGEEYATYVLFERPDLPGAAYAGWVSNSAWIAMAAFIAIFPVLRYPTGRPMNERWRLIERLAVVAVVISWILASLTPGPLDNFTDLIDNPFGWSRLGGTTRSEPFLLTPFLVAMAAATYCAVLRYRRATGIERQQMKWLVFASALCGLIMVVGNGIIGTFIPRAIDLMEGLTLASFLAVPGAMAIAILRYRLYDIDLVINKTLVYLVLSALLALVYFSGVAMLQSVIGLGERNDLAVAASTLAVAGLFQPLRSRIQGFIDHYFYRRKYDAQQTIDGFTTALRNEIDLEALNHELIGVVDETMQPRSVSLWLISTEDNR